MLVSSRAATSRSVPDEVLAAPLAGGARVDVCIAGAGLAGLLAAYLLSRARHSVMVLEEGALGGPYAVPEVAHMASRIDMPFEALAARLGEDGARIAAQSHVAAIDAVEAVVRREHIACDFERLDGYRFAARGDTRASLEAEVQAARRAGLDGVELSAAAPIEGGAGGPCVRYASQAQLHPVKLAAGLARAITREGGRIHCGVRTRAVQSGRPSTLLTTAGHRVEAQVLVVPGAAPAVPRIAHAVGLRVPRGSVTRALYWEHGIDGTRHARLRSGAALGEVLIAAGGDDPEALAAWARSRFPRSSDVLQRFCGEVPRAPDLFAFVGEKEADSESVYVGGGSWGTAMTRAAIAGMVIRDFAEGVRTPAADLDSPSACYTPREAGRRL
jgi:glycine/D-amino acid oxidase-like deaminating enzyme